VENGNATVIVELQPSMEYSSSGVTPNPLSLWFIIAFAMSMFGAKFCSYFTIEKNYYHWYVEYVADNWLHWPVSDVTAVVISRIIAKPWNATLDSTSMFPVLNRRDAVSTRDVRKWLSCTHSLPFPSLHSHFRPWEILNYALYKSTFTLLYLNYSPVPIYSRKVIPIPSHSHSTETRRV